MKSCSVCLADDDEYRSTVMESEPLLTPWYRELDSEDVEGQGRRAPDYNYVPYDLYCLKTRMKPLLYAIDPTWELEFYSLPTENNVTVYGGIFSGSDMIQLNKQDAKILQAYIDNILNDNNQYNLIFDSSLPLFYKKIRLPQDWLYVMADHIYDELKDDFPVIKRDGQVLIYMEPDNDYTNDWLELMEIITQELGTLYLRGAIYLSQSQDKEFIKAWSLYPLKSDRDYTIHIPTWMDSRITTNATRLLESQYLSLNLIDFKVKYDFNLNTLLAQKLPSDAVFSRSYVQVECKSYAEAKRIADIIECFYFDQSDRFIQALEIEFETDFKTYKMR